MASDAEPPRGPSAWDVRSLAATFALAKLRGDGPSAIEAAANIAMLPRAGIAASRNTLNDGATVRNIYSGHSGRAGFQALALRDAGFTGEADAAVSVLGKIYGSAFDPAAATADLNSTWWIDETTSSAFLPDATHVGARTPLMTSPPNWAAGLRPNSSSASTLRPSSWQQPWGRKVCARRSVCRFSIPMLVAQRIAHGLDPSHRVDGTHAFADPAVGALRRGVCVQDKSCNGGLP